MLNKELLDALACPKCRGEVKLAEDETAIICETCKLAYEIDGDIPVMLIDSAKEL